jgi:hypothetical protein
MLVECAPGFEQPREIDNDLLIEALKQNAGSASGFWNETVMLQSGKATLRSRVILESLSGNIARRGIAS